MELAEGTRIGAYVLRRELGRGGMASVWEAEHVDLQKRVALKILAADVAKNAVAAARFAREGRAAVRVRHPHVVDVVDVGAHEGVPFLVLELISGPTLATVLSREAPLSVARIASLFLPIVSAMKRAHAASVVHRDLKPANVLLASDLHGDVVPKIADFGISKILDPNEAELTREHGVVGTLLYMSPEQVRSAASADARSDQWALGVMLYQASTGTLPFEGESSAQVIHAILEAKIEPPSARRPNLPASFDALILRALARDPRERFPDMQALGAALLEHAEGRTWSTWARELATRNAETTADEELPHDEGAATHGPAVRTAPGAPPRRATWLAIAFAAIVGVGITLRVLTRDTRAPAPIAATPPAATSAIAATSAPPPPRIDPPAAPSPAPSPSASVVVPAVKPKAASSKPKPPTIGPNGAPILE